MVDTDDSLSIDVIDATRSYPCVRDNMGRHFVCECCEAEVAGKEDEVTGRLLCWPCAHSIDIHGAAECGCSEDEIYPALDKRAQGEN